MPKIIHQIWIGENKRPDIWMDTIKKFCNDFGYEYKLWDDNNVNTLNLINKEYYDKEPSLYLGSKNYQLKSDILRYEILYQYGGIYIDADTVITNGEKLNTIINDFSNDVGFGWEKDNTLIANSVIFSVKNSKFMKECIDGMKDRDLSEEPYKSVGPQYITKIYNTKKYDDIKLYPSKLFYPIHWDGIDTINAHTKNNYPDSVMFQYGYTTNNMVKLIGGSKQKAYVINLVDRVDRKNNMIQKFEKTIFDLEFIEAIKNEKGHLGFSLSMQKLVQKAKDLNLETVLFFEDDNKPLENFEERWLIAKKWLDNNLDKWDIFNGGAALWDKKALDSVKLIQNLDNGINLFQADLILNANWIYLNKSSYDKILNWKLEDHPTTISIDSFMGDKKHFTTLFIYPFLGLQESGPSNTDKGVIRNYSNNSKQKTNDQRIKNMEEVSNKLLRL